jgi:hypothetical protein
MVPERERERVSKKINTAMDIMILSVVWGGGGNRKLNNKSVSLIHHQTCTVAFLAMTREYYKNL